MKDEKIDGLRTEYLAAMAELAGLSVERASHLPSEMGMSALRSAQEAEESAKAVAKITRRIAEVCNRARAIEQRARGGIGIPTLFALDVPNAIRVAVAILIGKFHSGSWQHECRSVGSLLQPAAGADINDLIAVREAFRKGGLLTVADLNRYIRDQNAPFAIFHRRNRNVRVDNRRIEP